MAPVSTRKLILQQRDRAENISRILPAFRKIEKSRLNRALVRDRIQKLHGYWIKFCKRHEEIITRDDIADDPYLTESFFASTEDLRDECNDELSRVLAAFPNDDVANTSTASQSSVSNENSNTVCHNLHLPKIDLPHFSGKYEDWEAFENRFSSLIHEKAQVPNVVKLQYLMGCLQGPAADFVKDVAVTDANYVSTWNALKDRFSNLRLQVYNLTHSLIKNPSLKKESASGLRALVDDVTHRVRMLKNIGRPVDHWDALLVVIVSERLDSVTRKSWETYLSTRSMQGDQESGAVASRKKPPTFKELIDFLEGTIQALTSVETESCPEKSAANGKSSGHYKLRGLVKSHHSGAKYKAKSSTSNTVVSDSRKCPLCSLEHYVGRCDKFKALSGSDRHNEIRRLGLCFNCLGQHQVRNCNSKRFCRKCQGPHHTMLHRDGSHVQPDGNAVATVPLTQQTTEKKD
ncbi:uncharacterized protein [Prorops nasuta]|uniref:uncharacterized protein n=1 Tax=Prorops nasuta TaxID=863751 RepID=UPI0034CED6DC